MPSLTILKKRLTRARHEELRAAEACLAVATPLAEYYWLDAVKRVRDLRTQVQHEAAILADRKASRKEFRR